MSQNPHWEVVLARSADMSELGALPFAFTLTPIFNRPGSYTATLPLDHDVAYKIAKHSTCVVCERNEEVKWSGSIVSVDRDPAAMTMTISALGWLDELNHRFVRAGEESALSFVNVAGGAIVQALVSTVNAQQDVDGTVRPTHVGFASYQDSQTRTRAYKRGQNYGQAIQELSDVENGLDLYVDAKTRQVVTKPPTAYVDRRKVLFGYGVEPFNLANASQKDDGSSTANRITAVGANGVVVPADDATAIASAGIMLEDWLSLSDVSDTIIIGAYANAELVYRRFGNVTYDLKPRPYGDVPRLYDDFELGDKVYLSIDAGALQLDNQALRVFSVTIDVDAQGNEVITAIGTAPQS